MTDCELIVVDRRDFTALVRDDPKNRAGDDRLFVRTAALGEPTIRGGRVPQFTGRLAKLLGRLGVKNAAGGPQKLAITQRELSQLTNTSRESINKQLQVWAKLNWLRLERGGIVVLAPDAIAPSRPLVQSASWRESRIAKFSLLYVTYATVCTATCR